MPTAPPVLAKKNGSDRRSAADSFHKQFFQDTNLRQ
jgi:hypothetical protein